MTGIGRTSGSDPKIGVGGVSDAPETVAGPGDAGGAPAPTTLAPSTRPKSLDMQGLDLRRMLDERLTASGTGGPKTTSTTSTSLAPNLAPIGASATTSAGALLPKKIESGDPLQLVRGVKDGKVAVEIPLAPGKHKIRGVNVTVKENTVMKVFVEVKDGKLIPARDARGKQKEGGCKIDFVPPLDLPLISGKGLYLKEGDEGGAAGKLKADLGGFFDIRVKQTGTLVLDDLVSAIGNHSMGLEGQEKAEGGSPLPEGLLDVKKLKFDVKDLTLTDGVVDTGAMRIDLSPGSNVSLGGTLEAVTLKGDVKIDSLSMNQGGLDVKTGAGSASFEAKYVKNADGTMAANTRISNLDATIEHAETTRPLPGGGEPDHLKLGRTTVKSGTINAHVTLGPRAGSPRPQVIGIATAATFDAEGRIDGAKLTVKDAKDDAEVRLGSGDFKGKLVLGEKSMVLDGSLAGGSIEMKGLQTDGAGGAAVLDLHHAKVAGDARVSIDTGKKAYDVTVDAKEVDIRIDDYKGEKGTTAVDLARTDITGNGTVRFSKTEGLAIDGDLAVKGGFDDLKVAPGKGKAAIDVAGGSTVDAQVTHFAAGRGKGIELDARGKVDIGLEKYDVNLPGVSATGTASVKAGTTVRIREGEFLMSDLDGSISVAVDDAKVAQGGKGFQLDAGKGSKLDLNVEGSTISSDATKTLVKLGKGSKLEAVLDGGQVDVQGKALKLEKGSRARFDITSLAAGGGTGGGPALKGKLSIDARVSGATVDLQGLPKDGRVSVEVGAGGKAQAKIKVDDVTLKSDGSFSLKGVDVGVNAKVGSVLSATSPEGTLSADAVRGKSASAIAGAKGPAAGGPAEPIEIAKRIRSGTFEVEIPIEGTVGDSYLKSATFAPGTKVKIAVKVKDGKIDPDATKATISRPGDGALWVTVNGAYFDASNTLRLDLGGMKDFAVPNMENMPRDVDAFIDRLTKPKAGGAEKSGGGDKLAALKVAELKFTVSDATIEPGPLALPGGVIDIAAGTKLSVAGDLKTARVQGRVAVNGMELDQDGIAVKTGKGSLDLKIDYRTQGGTAAVTTSLSNMDLDVRYAVQKRANGDYIHLAEGKVEDASFSLTAKLPIDPKTKKPGGKPTTSEAKLTLPRFSGRIEGGRVTIKDKDGTAQLELGRTAVKGSVTVDKGKIALEGEVTELDAALQSFSGGAKGGSAKVETARLQGSGKVKLASDGRLDVDANVKNVRLKADEIKGRRPK